MTPTQRPPDNAPFSPTERVESLHRSGPLDPDPGDPAGGRRLVIGLLLLSVTLVSAGVGFLVSGGRLPATSESSRPAPTPTAQVAAQPAAPPAQQPAATTAPVAAAPPEPTQAPATPTAAAKPTTPPPPTAPPATSVPAAKPTSAPPTGAPAAQAPKPTSPPALKPAAAQSTSGGDPRLPQIEGRIREYFAALNAEDYARAHQVCCTDAWRSRYPLAQWERNFDGVSNLELVGEPRYRRVEPELIEVDTDYTFVSGGRQRDFTLRWTFQPVGPAGNEWQAELAEAFAR